MVSKVLRAISYHGTRNFEAGYKPSHTSKTLIGYIVCMEKQDTVWNEILECIRKFQQPNSPACKKGRLRFAGLMKQVPWEPR